MTNLRKPPLDRKYMQSTAAHKLVRDLMEISESTVQGAKIAEEAQRKLSQRGPDLDSWPWGDRIRQSF